MIPKRIFFIWLGNNIPKYVNFAISNFKTVNPSYEIIFLNYSIDDLKHIFYDRSFNSTYDELLFNSILIIFNDLNAYHDHLYRFMVYNNLKLYGNELRFILVLSDIYRLELLNHFGGIYLDCDTFPIKPFDDFLLKTEYFVVAKHINSGFKHILDPDNYFIGSSGGHKKITKNDEDFTYKLLQSTDNWWYNFNFLILKKRFFNLQMKYGEWSLSPDFYIEHYCDANWKDLPIKGIRTPYCFLDDEYKKIRHDKTILL